MTPASPGNIGELSQAVASVNDWRALGLFLVFVMLAQMAGSAWQRFLDRRALERLAGSLDRFSEQLTASTSQSLLHQARVEAILARLDP